MSDELVLQQLLTETLKQSTTLTTLVTKVDALVGNGQPGRITLIEKDVEDLKSSENKRIGATGVILFVIASWEFVKYFFKIT